MIDDDDGKHRLLGKVYISDSSNDLLKAMSDMTTG